MFHHKTGPRDVTGTIGTLPPPDPLVTFAVPAPINRRFCSRLLLFVLRFKPQLGLILRCILLP